MVGSPDSDFLNLVGCKHPIIQAPMAGAAWTALCIAVIQGGALGSLPCGMLSPEQVGSQASSALALFRAAAEKRGEYGFGPIWAGQAAPLGKPLPAAELTCKLAADALAIPGERK